VDVLVIDEAHRTVALHGMSETPLTKNARKLAHAARHLLLLSATPVLQSRCGPARAAGIAGPGKLFLGKTGGVQGSARRGGWSWGAPFLRSAARRCPRW